jgi:N-acetylmuramoyl-L-alanine amidase
MPRFRVRNRLRTGEEIGRVTVTISRAGPPPVSVSGTTNAAGIVNLNTATLADGAYVLTAVPHSASADPVGPATAETPVPPSRIFRSLTADLTIAAHAVTAVTVAGLNRPNGAVAIGTGGVIVIDLQPVWMQSPNEGGRGGNQIQMIIVHHTGGPLIGPAINTFMSASEQTSAHYIIDTDGQVLKVVRDSRHANHAGTAHWAGVSNINNVSIGIEIVNQSGPYPGPQINALLDLIAALRTAHPTIVDWNIIGHSDVATSAAGVLGRKSSDPGLRFEWAKLEARRWGMLKMIGPQPPTIYANVFGTFAGVSLRKNDNDARRVFGGTKRAAAYTGNPVRELQDDLTAIGYTVGTPDGDFGGKTHGAVKMLQEHFFAGGRGHKAPDGQVDQQTAELIKTVLGAHP